MVCNWVWSSVIVAVMVSTTVMVLSITRVDSTVEKYVVGSMSVLTEKEVTVAVIKSVAVAVET